MTTLSDLQDMPLSGVLTVDALLGDGPMWNFLTGNPSNKLYYGFSGDGSYSSAVYNVSLFNGTQVAAANQAIAYIETVTGIDFIETLDPAEAQFTFLSANVTEPNVAGLTSWGASWSYSGSTVTSYRATADIYLDVVDYTGSLAPTTGTSGYQVLLHEIAHALGLKHPFEGTYQLPDALDNTDNTLMSYTWTGANKSLFQAFDLEALWWIYGGDGLGGTYGINSLNGPSLLTATDTTPPAVTQFNPADGASNVAAGANIVITFDEAIQRGTGDIVLRTATGVTLATYDAATSSNLAIAGNTLTINPGSDLAANTEYRIDIAAGAIEDLAGNNYAGTTSYNFTTANTSIDTTPPAVLAFSPSDEAVNVAIGTSIVLTFSETIQHGTGTIFLKTAAGFLVESYNAATSGNLIIAGNTLTVTPTSSLSYSTEYKLELAAGNIKDLAGNSYAGTTSYNFSTAPPSDTLPPSVTQFNPPDEATSVTITSNLVLSFSEAIQRGSGIIVLKNSTGAVIETFSAASSTRLNVAGNTLTIDPTANLAYATDYRLELDAGAIRDLAGNNYAGTTSYNFATELPPDSLPPSVTLFSPPDEAPAVAIDSNMVLTFSEAIQRGSGSIVLKAGSGAVIETFLVASSNLLTVSGSTLTINPSSDLDYATAYTLELDAGSIKDLAGNSYAGTTSYNFTSAPPPDTTPPEVTQFSPADAATDVAIGSNIVLSFNEEIQRGTGYITLKTAAGSTVALYNAASSSNLSIAGSTLTLNPSNSLGYGTDYRIEFAGGSITDLAGNPYVGTSTYNFTTENAPAIPGTPGDDSFTGTSANNSFDGAAGTDTVIFTGDRAAYTITKTSTGYTVSGSADGTDTLTHVERAQFADQTLDLSPLSDYGTRLQVFATAWLDRQLTPEELIGYCANYAEVAAAGGNIYATDLHAFFLANDAGNFLDNPDPADMITDMYERLTGSRDVPQEMLDTFIDRLENNWRGPDVLAVKMIKAGGFWVNTDGSYGVPANFRTTSGMDYADETNADLPALQAQLADDLPFVITDDADDALILVGVAGV